MLEQIKYKVALVKSQAHRLSPSGAMLSQNASSSFEKIQESKLNWDIWQNSDVGGRVTIMRHVHTVRALGQSLAAVSKSTYIQSFRQMNLKNIHVLQS